MTNQRDPLMGLRSLFDPLHPNSIRNYRDSRTIAARARSAAERAHRLAESAAGLEADGPARDEHLAALRELTADLIALTEQAENLESATSDLEREIRLATISAAAARPGPDPLTVTE